jgi:signal peptidase II
VNTRGIFLRNRYFFGGYLIAALTTLADQLHKWYMLEIVNISKKPIHVADFFNLVMVWNPGISFGMFRNHNYSAYIFSALALVIVAFLSAWLYKTTSRFSMIAIGFVIGGALGNVADRLRFGAVADFFDFHVQHYHWPAFNIADAMVFTGAVMLCIESAFGKNQQRSKDPA